MGPRSGPRPLERSKHIAVAFIREWERLDGESSPTALKGVLLSDISPHFQHIVAIGKLFGMNLGTYNSPYHLSIDVTEEFKRAARKARKSMLLEWINLSKERIHSPQATVVENHLEVWERYVIMMATGLAHNKDLQKGLSILAETGTDKSISRHLLCGMTLALLEHRRTDQILISRLEKIFPVFLTGLSIVGYPDTFRLFSIAPDGHYFGVRDILLPTTFENDSDSVSKTRLEAYMKEETEVRVIPPIIRTTMQVLAPLISEAYSSKQIK